MWSYSRIVVYVFLLVVFSFVVFGVPSTECTEDPGAPGCQQPFYTDDQSSYLFDLTSSWIFADHSTPDDSGPTVFEGGQVTLLGVASHSDEVFGSDYLERYIEDPGEAEDGVQEEWGRGSLTGVNIDMDDSKEADGRHGDKKVNPPYEGMCGDGIPNTGDEETCPEDHGTPTPIVLDGQPQPLRNNFYSEPSGDYEFTISSDDAEHHLEGSKANSPDYYSSGGYIIRENISGPGEETILSGTHTYASETDYDPTREFVDGTSEVDTCEGDDCISPSERCFGRHPTGEFRNYNSDGDETDTVSETTPTTEYDAPNEAPQTLEVEVEYTTEVDLSAELYQPTDCRTVYTECDGDSFNDADCEMEEEVDYYPVFEEGSSFREREIDWEVTYDTFGLSTSQVWGPVNRKPDDLFGGYPGVDVLDTDFGYHTVVDDDTSQGSNNPSVSANRYSLEEGSTYFEAHRQASNVGNADGPDGELNGVVAYHETHGIKGGAIGFGNETWDGERSTYVQRSDLEEEIESQGGCPGDTVRCVASIDIRTAESGWGGEPLDSYEVRLQ